MTNILSSFMKNLVCSQDECLSWIIILINILTVFYLVFCAWFKVTKAVKVVGYVWASALTVGTVAVVAVHTCIFTILSAVFTALIVMAVLSVVFDKGVLERVDTEEKPLKASGSYVIHKTDKNNYAFIIYDNRKKAIAKSCFKYVSISETKEAIELCRKNGYIAAVEDRTKSWIEFVNHPKFELVNNGGKYSFTMSLINETVIIKSEVFDDYEQCRKTMDSVISAVRSDKLYFAEYEVLSDGQFEGNGDEIQPVAEEPKKEPETVTIAEEDNTVTATESPVEEPKTEEMESKPIETEKADTEKVATLKEGFELAAATVGKKEINKKYVAEYLKSKFGENVEINCRANYIKSGKLPLADTHYAVTADTQYVLAADKHYAVSNKTRRCFAFVYEINNTVMLLLRLTDEVGQKLAKAHSTVQKSAFPKLKDSWYSIIVDDSFTNEEVEDIIAESFMQTKGESL